MPESHTYQHGYDAATTAPSALESATAYLRRGRGAVSPELAGTDRNTERIEQRLHLIEWANAEGKLTTGVATSDYYRLLQTGSELTGNEHTVVVAPDEGRVFKITHLNRYGKAYPRIEGLAVYRDATPLEYLVRLMLCNEALGDNLWLEQILLDESGAVRIVTSQPIISGIHPTVNSLYQHLFQSGFEPLEAVDGVPMTKCLVS